MCIDGSRYPSEREMHGECTHDTQRHAPAGGAGYTQHGQCTKDDEAGQHGGPTPHTHARTLVKGTKQGMRKRSWRKPHACTHRDTRAPDHTHKAVSRDYASKTGSKDRPRCAIHCARAHTGCDTAAPADQFSARQRSPRRTRSRQPPASSPARSTWRCRPTSSAPAAPPSSPSGGGWTRQTRPCT